MKFLMMSARGDGLGLALRLKQNGHQVAAWIKGKTEKENYEGLIEKIDKRWEDYLDEKTIVIFDSSGGGRTADRLRARGHFVFAGSTFADNLEYDRELAFELLAQCGVKVPPFKTFYSWQDGKAYVKNHKKKVVFKATGEMSNDAGLGSYVSPDPDDMIMMMEYYESLAKHKPEFIIQDFVEGVAVSTEGWFNGYEWMEPFNHTIENKAMMVDNLGPSSGCTFDTVWRVEGMNEVVEKGVKAFGDIANEYKHIGLIDLNTIVNEEGAWALEFTPRMGYDAFPTLLELIDGDIGETIAKMARGEQPDEIPLKKGFASALRISIPPHPSEEFIHTGGVPIQGLSRSDRPHLYFFEVKLTDRDNLVSSKGGGALVAVTGVGEDIRESLKGPYEIANRVRIPEKQFRTDAEKVLTCDYARFQRYLSLTHNVMKEVGGVPG